MRIVDLFRSVRHTFAANRARAALTLLGIVIGAGSIVLLAGLLRGGEEALIQSSQRANESDLVQVNRDEPPSKQLRKTRRELAQGDADNLDASRLLGGAAVGSEVWRESTARSPKRKRVRLVGAVAGALELYHLQIERGRYLTDADLAERRRVCVIGQEIWRDLFDEDPAAIGRQISVEDQLWTVVGVLKNKPLLGGAGDGTWMWNRKMLVPHTTFDALFAPSHEVRRLYVRLAASETLVEKMQAVEQVIDATLLRRHLGVHNFKIEGGEGERNQERLIVGIIKLLLLGTGLLSLFVGGINIMNIMLVTVTERTREIGVRRAVGATPSAVLAQFLLEAALIAATGGIIGVVGGMALCWVTAAYLAHALGGWNLHIEPWSIALGLGLSLGTGIVFGLFPAWRAARLDPVEALRYE